MKRELACFTLIALLLAMTALTACNGGREQPSPSDAPAPTNAPVEEAFSGDAGQILNSIVELAITKDTDTEFGIGAIACTNVYVDSDSCEDVLGLTPDEFAERIEYAVESKPVDSWQPHSIVLIKASDGQDVAALAQTITAKTNPARFGCLRVPAIVGGYAGQYIVIVASAESGCEAAYAAFDELAKAPSTRIERENDWGNAPFC